MRILTTKTNKMRKPKRSDDKYWTGTRNFNHIQYESDLEDYIIDLEAEREQCILANVRLSLPCFRNIKEAAEQVAETSFKSSEVEKRVAMHSGFLDGAKWMQERVLGNEA